MTDNEIIKALECCQTQYAKNCEKCPYERYKKPCISAITCSSQMRADLLDLINRQRAEIERRSGHWIDNRNGTFTCSVCGGNASKMDYCGRCGADMRGENNDR